MSSSVTILAAQPPDIPAAPTTTLQDTNVLISWAAPFNQGSAITSYKIQIRQSDNVSYSLELTDCDGSQNIFIAQTKCSIPVSVLRGSPFNLPWGASVYATVVATNVYGDSGVSSAGNGAVLMTYPDAPISLVENLAARTVSTIGVQWQIGPNNNGATVTQYVVSMATGSGAYVVLYSGLSTFITSATATGLTFGTQYTFVVQSGNLFGLS